MQVLILEPFFNTPRHDPIRYNLTLIFDDMEAKYSCSNFSKEGYIELKRRPKFYINQAVKVDWEKLYGHDIVVCGFIFRLESFTEKI